MPLPMAPRSRDRFRFAVVALNVDDGLRAVSACACLRVIRAACVVLRSGVPATLLSRAPFAALCGRIWAAAAPTTNASAAAATSRPSRSRPVWMPRATTCARGASSCGAAPAASTASELSVSPRSASYPALPPRSAYPTANLVSASPPAPWSASLLLARLALTGPFAVQV